MTKYLNHLLFLFFFLLGIPQAGSQELSDISVRIEQRFRQYCNNYPWEEVFIHTDREDYISGEDVWFALYLFDRQSSELNGKSRIIYFEILNPDNRPVVQQRVEIDKGTGRGHAVLPDTLSSGKYNIRAYTKWMSNFLPANCFMKEIRINNALNKRVLADVSYSPVLSPENSTAGRDAGNPEPGLLKVNDLKTGTLEIIIDPAADSRLRNSGVCYIFIQTHGIVDMNKSLNLTSGTNIFTFERRLLSPGINQITLFSSAGEPLAEKYIYTQGISKQDIKLNSADTFERRSLVKLNMECSAGIGSAIDKASLSISVSPSTGKPAGQDISDHLIFGSEFGILPREIKEAKPGEIPPEVIDRFLSRAKSYWIDWKKILADSNPDLKYLREDDNHYLSGQLINRDSKAPVPSEFVFLSTPSKVATFQYARTDNNGKFSFEIPINEKLNNLIIQPEKPEKNYYVRLESAFSEVYPDKTGINRTLSKNALSTDHERSVNYQVGRIYGTTYYSAPVNNPEIQTWSGRFYGKPDIELVMADYIKLPVMQEVFFELTPGVYLKAKKSVYEMSIADPVENRIFSVPPVLFVDGVVVRDAGVIANINPEIVERIDMVKVRYLVGDYLFYGLVNVITSRGDFSAVELPLYAVRLSYRAVDPVGSFVPPAYETQQMKESRVPDLRNTLYWNPEVLADKDGKAVVEFWSSDYISDYVIRIEGVAPDGKPYSVSKNIRVE